jgi:ribosomal protein S18 acetylase RimI-like enzyme
VDDSGLRARIQATLAGFGRMLADCSPDARSLEIGSVNAQVNPAVPDSSLLNGVDYEDPADLPGALEELTETYRDAGVRAWTVWVPEDDAGNRELVRSRGHVLDADPAAMILELDRLEPELGVELDLDPEARIADLARLNDLAYGTSYFVDGLVVQPPTTWLYVARVDGRPASTVMTFDHDGDCYVAFVATDPAAQGRGLATALMTHALVEGRERGCTISTLEATRAGEPIYRRMGYRRLFAYEMWERRQPAGA